MVLFQALVIGLTALTFTPGYSFYFDVTPKLVVLFAGVAVLLVWMTFQFRTAPRWFSILIVLSVLSVSVSTAVSVNPGLSAYGTVWRRFGSLSQAVILVFAWVLAAQTAGRTDRVRIVLRGVAVSGFVSAAYGICQYAGWDPLLNPASYHIGDGIWTIVRPPGTLGYVSYFAAWLLAVVFLSMALAHLETNGWCRRFAMCTAALSLVAMLLTGTRAAIVGLAIGAIVELRYRRTFRVTRRSVVWAGLFVLCGAGFWFSPVGWPLHARLRWASEDPWGGARPALWKDSLWMAAHHPALGFGPETFQATFPHYESPALARAYPDFAHESPHNIFLDVLVSQGLPGLAVLVLLCLFCLRRSVPWLTAAFAAAIVYQQFTVFNLATALIFYTNMALLVAMTSPEAENRQIPLLRFALSPLAVCLLLLAIRYGAADRHLALTREGLNAGNLPAAKEHYTAYERLQPGPTDADLWFSQALLDFARRSGNPTARVQAVILAETASRRSVQTAERPFDAWFYRAILFASQNKALKTEKALRSATAAHPHWFKPHWMLAKLLCVQLRYQEAVKEAEVAVDLDGKQHSEVLQTLNLVRSLQAQVITSGLRK